MYLQLKPSVCWSNFNFLVVSSRRGYLSLDVRSSQASAISCDDRLPFPLLAHHGVETMLCATQSGCLCYHGKETMSTVSIPLEEPPLSMKSQFPWAVAAKVDHFFL